MGAASRTRAPGGPGQKQAPPSARPAAPETGRRGQGPPAPRGLPSARNPEKVGNRTACLRPMDRGTRGYRSPPDNAAHRGSRAGIQPGPPRSLTGCASEAAGRPVLAHRCGRGGGGSIREVDRRRTVSPRRTQEGPALGEGGLQAEEPPSCSRGPDYGEAGKWGVTRPQPPNSQALTCHRVPAPSACGTGRPGPTTCRVPHLRRRPAAGSLLINALQVCLVRIRRDVHNKKRKGRQIFFSNIHFKTETNENSSKPGTENLKRKLIFRTQSRY